MKEKEINVEIEKKRSDEFSKENSAEDSTKRIYVKKNKKFQQEQEDKNREEEKSEEKKEEVVEGEQFSSKRFKKNRFGKKDIGVLKTDTNDNLGLYGRKFIPKEIELTDDEDDKKNISSEFKNVIDFRNSIISLGMSRGKSTKIKIYKCVVWKNYDPNVNEKTIENFIRRSGSQIFEKGGFIMKLPSKHNILSNNISTGKFDNISVKEN